MTGPASPGDRSGPVGGITDSGAVLTTGLAALAGLVLGLIAGLPGVTTLGIAGALLAATGGRFATATVPARRAAGSTGVVVGVLCAMFAVEAAGTDLGIVLVGTVTLAVGMVGFDALVGPGSEGLGPSVIALGEAFLVLLYGGLSAIALSSLSPAAFVGSLSQLFDRLAARFLVLLAGLQLGVIVLSVLLEHVENTLDRWLPAGGSERFPVLSRIAVEATEVPRILWAAVGLQLFFTLLFPQLSTIAADLLLSTLPGQVVYAVLTSPLLYAPLVIAIAIALAVLLLEAGRVGLVIWGGYDPPAMIALGVGGFVVTVTTAAVLAVPPVGTAASEALASAGSSATSGVTATVLLMFCGATMLATIVLWLVSKVSVRDLFRGDFGLLVGAGLLLVASVVASELGGHPLAVFAVVGLALLVADTGRRSHEFRRSGALARTLDPELVHLEGNLFVGAVGVVIAALGLYVVVPLVTGGALVGLLAVSLALVALLAFLTAMGIEGTA